MARAIAWWSESGGAGKTTNTMHSAAAIGRNDYDVLVWDLDPQLGSLTQHAGYPNLQKDDRTNVMDVFFGDAHLDDVIVNTPNFDLVPGHEDLADFETELASSNLHGADEFFVLRSWVEDLADDYDVFIFDLPATLGRIVDNGLIAARNVMVPLELTDKGDISLDGLNDTLDSMESGFRKMGVEMTIKGTVPSRVGNANIFDEVRSEIESRGVPVSPFSIPEHTLFKAAWKQRQDLFEFIDNPETRDLRKYEKINPIAYGVIGRWITGDLSYQEAVDIWETVDELDMSNVDPLEFLDNLDREVTA